MAKFTVKEHHAVSVHADGKVRMSEEFQARLTATAREAAKKVGTVQITAVEKDESHVTFNVSGAGISEFATALASEVTAMTEFGPDSDLLSAVFKKYPHLRGHPRLNELVGNFEMMMSKVKELDVDKKSKPSQATPALAKPGKPGRMTKQQLAQHREEKLKGQAPDQVQAQAAAADTGLKRIVTPPGAQNGPAVNIYVPESTNTHGKASSGR